MVGNKKQFIKTSVFGSRSSAGSMHISEYSPLHPYLFIYIHIHSYSYSFIRIYSFSNTAFKKNEDKNEKLLAIIIALIT